MIRENEDSNAKDARKEGRKEIRNEQKKGSRRIHER